MNTNSFHVSDSGVSPSQPLQSYQGRNCSVPILVSHNPYVRMESTPIVMVPPTSSGLAGVDVNHHHVNHHVMNIGIGPAMTNPTLPPPPPLTSFVRNVTPEYFMAATASLRPSPLVAFQRPSNDSMSGLHIDMNGLSSRNMSVAAKNAVWLNSVYHNSVNSEKLFNNSSQILLNLNTTDSNVSWLEQPGNVRNLCRDSLTDEEDSLSGGESEGRNGGKSFYSLCSIPTNDTPKRTSSSESSPRKRCHEMLAAESYKALGLKTMNKSAGKGAASWNTAVRKDMNRYKAQVASSPSKKKSAKRAYEDSPAASSDPDSSDSDCSSTEFLCDVCKNAVFDTYEEALAHEQKCREIKEQHSSSSDEEADVDETPVPPSLTRSVTEEGSQKSSKTNHTEVDISPTTLSRSISDDFEPSYTNTKVPTTSLARGVTDENEYNSPSVLMDDEKELVPLCQAVNQCKQNNSNRLVLATKEDKHWLSDLVCLIRENIEVFAATPADVAARSRRGGIKKPIALGRVGIRCIHCMNVPHDLKAKGAVSYPNSIRIVHQAVRNWQRYHFDACDKIPESVRKAYSALKSTRSHSGNASLKYWIDSTTNLGLVDTTAEDGMRFAEGKEPNRIMEYNGNTGRAVNEIAQESKYDSSLGTNTYHSSTVTEIDRATDDMKYEQPSLVIPSDKAEITDFLYELLDQQQACQYKAVDRNGKRKYRELGFPGVECKHCARNAGAGRYFPLMVTTLANNSNPFNCTHSHMMKCRRCPQEVKNKLAQLQLMHAEQGAKLPPGWKKRFFDKLWVRLHGTGSTPAKPDAVEHSQENGNIDNEIDSAAYALSSFSAQAFSDAAKAKAHAVL